MCDGGKALRTRTVIGHAQRVDGDRKYRALSLTSAATQLNSRFASGRGFLHFLREVPADVALLVLISGGSSSVVDVSPGGIRLKRPP